MSEPAMDEPMFFATPEQWRAWLAESAQGRRLRQFVSPGEQP